MPGDSVSSRVAVVDAPEQHRFEARLDGELVGIAAYVWDERAGVLVLDHTTVDPAHGGQGVGSALVRFALDDVRGRGDQVDPQCSFVAAWISRHPDYADLVSTARTSPHEPA